MNNVEQALKLHQQIKENDAALASTDEKERELDQANSRDWDAYDALSAERERLYSVGRGLADALGKLASVMSAEEKASYKAAL